MHTILVIDDDESIRTLLTTFFEAEGYTVSAAANGAQGWEQFIQHDPFIVILDHILPDARGIDLMKKMKDYDSETNIIIVTGYGEVKGAVKAMEIGAMNYLLKPLDLQELKILVKQAERNLAIKKERDFHRDRRQVLIKGRAMPLLFKSKAMATVLEQCEQVAATNSTILLNGESGTGKGVMAMYIHQIGDRCDGPFIDIDCTTIPEHLLESELFGYEPGAFTDAKKRKEGLIELAHNGTLFLDEISSLPMLLQGKLLKVIESKSFRKLGGKKEIQVNVRIIVATNLDLLSLVSNGTFRKDLYYRISTFPIILPPLKERKEDVIPLAEYFLNDIVKEFHKKLDGFEPEVQDALLNYHWPGNIRELRNTVERAIIISNHGTITKNDMHLEVSDTPPVQRYEVLTYAEALRQFNIAVIENALSRADGNQTIAAQKLGVSRNFLIRQMRKYDINPFKYKK